MKRQARDFFGEAKRNNVALFTSAEVMQELLHAYLPVGRIEFLEAAMALIARFEVEVLPLEREDVALAKQLYEQYPNLEARDLCHLASCRRRDIREIKTFDQAFQAAFAQSL